MKNTELIRGAECVMRSLPGMIPGKRCLIVTGKTSASKSGALYDVTEALKSMGCAFIVYNGMTENPPVDACREAGKTGRDYGAEFVIAIGGGSPIDGAKAASVFAVNPEMTDSELFDPDTPKTALPIIAVPITAGTGSEANASAVITYAGKKKSFTDPTVLPYAAFLDPRYLSTLNSKYTASTATDAFCHCFESYMSPKSTPESEKDALLGGRIMWRALTENDFIGNDRDAAGLSQETRAAMLDGAALGGRAIMTTGTGFTHPLGYYLTLRFGIPHGFACGAFTGEYVRYNLKTPEGREKVTAFADFIGTAPEIIAEVIPALSDVNLVMSENEISDAVKMASGAKNYKNSPAVIDDSDAEAIFRTLFG